MTREENLDWLYRLKSNIFVYMPKEWQIPMGNALNDAIKAFEQEQQADNEWCTDCKEYNHEKHCCPRFSQVIKTTFQECCENAISREDVLLMLTGEDLPDDATQLISIFSERIKKLPLVKPEQKIGHWIYDKDTDKARCSRCGSLCFADKLGRIETPFCPNCGADLREPKDGEK